MKPLANAVRLRAPSFCTSVIDVFDIHIKLVFVTFSLATVFGATVGKNPEQSDPALVIPWNYSVV